MSSEIILIGPFRAGKSTIGALLAQKLKLPQVSLDDLRFGYYREIGFDENLAKEIRQQSGFLALTLYWSLFNSYAIERVLADHRNCVIDFGAGPIVFESDELVTRIQRALAPYPYVFRLLPSPDVEESIRILQQRERELFPNAVPGFNWAEYFVKHHMNGQLAKQVVYTKDKTPQETSEEIVRLVAL
jgi:shikimate kinase